MITVIFCGIISACLTLFINYCIGKPGSEFSPYEIFSSYTVWLSKLRLSEMDLYYDYVEQYNENLQRAKTKYEKFTLKMDYHKILYTAAEPYFTWERMAGMCPVCFGFWISLISGIYFTQNIVHLVSIIVISHITIRILNKLL